MFGGSTGSLDREGSEAPNARPSMWLTPVEKREALRPMELERAVTVTAVQGFMELTGLSSAMLAARDEGFSWRREDDEICRVVDHALGEHPSRITSSVALAELLDVSDPRRLMRHFRRVASALLAMDHGRRWHLERHICVSLPKAALSQYIEVACYDETPLPTRLGDDPVPSHHARGEERPALQDDKGSHMVCRFTRKGSMVRVQTGKAPQKVVQTRLTFAMLFRVNDEFIAIAGTSPAPLCVVERTTSKVFKEISERLSHATRAARIWMVAQPCFRKPLLQHLIGF